LYVRDMDEMLDFYCNVLGFEVTDRGPLGPPEGPEIVFMSQVASDHHQLAFVPTRQEDQPSNSHNHMAFRTESLGDVRRYGEALRKDGRVENLLPLCHGNAWSYYFADPEGNGIEIFCDTPFHVAQPQGKPWDESLSDDELLEWTRAEFSAEPEFGPIDAFYRKREQELGATRR
jgi:catechol 2,3-dioxygenase-like lactoylglutathione lyase family enzyme